MNRIFLFVLSIAALVSCKNEHPDLPDGLYAEIETNKGTIVTTLDFENAPVTVANFITLAEGKNPYVSKKYKGKPFYDGLTFHRVMANFMIQGGDPDGDGSGGPGYKFRDEFSDESFDKAGILAMANAGPGTNGSQFFITHLPTPFLNGKHTIFGHVFGKGMETVNSIEVGDIIKSITIIRNGEAAKRFDALKVFNDYVATDEENQRKQAVVDAENKRLYDENFREIKEKKVAELEAIKATAEKTKSGLRYKILKKGSGKKPTPGQEIHINYAGFLENGSMFDSNIEAVARQYGKFDQRRADAGIYTPIPFEAGRKDGMIAGFIEGIEKLSIGDKAVIFIPSNLGYGPQGAGGIIPPNANLIFEIELVNTEN
jgi:cyclophilin family peptidyl-prolyl cis-trans isomerase